MKITTGKIEQPKFVIIYSAEGVGKSTFASEAPQPIFLDVEKGSLQLDVARNTDIKSFQDIMNSIEWLRKEKHDFKTVVLDSLDHIEPLVWGEVCRLDGKATNIEEAGGGFQKGYGLAVGIWKQLIDSLRSLRSERSMNIICIAHAKILTVNDPMTQIPYEKYSLKLQENKQSSALALWKESVDAVLFAAYIDTVFKVNQKDKKGKSSGEGVRKLFTTRTSTWDAKNRMGLPSELPFSLGDSWDAFDRAANSGNPDSLEQLKSDLSELLAFFEEKDKAVFERLEKAIATAGVDIKKLIGIRNHARILESQAS